MTLVIHLVRSSVWGSRVARVHVAVAVLLQLLNTTGWGLVLAGNLSTRLVADGRKLDLRASGLLVAGRWLGAVVGILSIRRVSLHRGCASTLLFSLALVLFFLLASLPFLADLLEFYEDELLVETHTTDGGGLWWS